MTHHHYKTTIQWTGNKGTGTSSYRDYERSHTISVQNKPIIECSSDPAFRGDKTKYNPEEMLLSSLSSGHMLWYLHFCSEAGIIVLDYTDEATGIMQESSNGSGRFTEVILNPRVIVENKSMINKAIELHHKANGFCFIANSVNFPVKHIPQVLVN
ncbi:OsmC family protein [Chryseobacterium daeguense]|uniref:OsmC family protein n=1 Tax=Chryseobacterium daeguense TaxID=412438 RepID=UPI00040574C4|nr:OsmC family protein [Chryseobacterium daeguense]